MKKYLILAALLPLLVAAQCNSPAPVHPPPPPPPPLPIADAAPSPAPTPLSDAAPAPSPLPTPAGAVCSNLHDAGCDEARSVPACAKVLQHTLDTDLTKVPMVCLLSAHTKTAVHACGSFLTCP